jgi:hypothetical protein
VGERRNHYNSSASISDLNPRKKRERERERTDRTQEKPFSQSDVRLGEEENGMGNGKDNSSLQAFGIENEWKIRQMADVGEFDPNV